MFFIVIMGGSNSVLTTTTLVDGSGSSFSCSICSAVTSPVTCGEGVS